MRAVFGQVCQSLMVVSNCRPGIAAQVGGLGDLAEQVAGPVGVHRRGRRAPRGSVQGWSSTTAFMKSSVTRTELLEFWKKTDA